MKFAVANWKMKMDMEKINDWVREWVNFEIGEKVKPIVAPSFVHLPLVTGIDNIALCTQDVSVHEAGAHTGDVGAYQISEICRYSIVGHSERKESYDDVMKKAKNCLENNITPIICFVDTEKADRYVMEGAFLAWEDPTNISKDGVYNPKNTDEIKQNFDKMIQQLSKDTVLLYGGSVNKNNISELNLIPGLYGVLVGNASLDAKHFYEICKELK